MRAFGRSAQAIVPVHQGDTTPALPRQVTMVDDGAGFFGRVGIKFQAERRSGGANRGGDSRRSTGLLLALGSIWVVLSPFPPDRVRPLLLASTPPEQISPRDGFL